MGLTCVKHRDVVRLRAWCGSIWQCGQPTSLANSFWDENTSGRTLQAQVAHRCPSCQHDTLEIKELSTRHSEVEPDVPIVKFMIYCETCDFKQIDEVEAVDRELRRRIADLTEIVRKIMADERILRLLSEKLNKKNDDLAGQCH